MPACTDLCARNLAVSTQDVVGSFWLHRLAEAKTTTPASDLYAGLGFRRAMAAASNVNVPVYIISAGLGLVAARRHIPSYDLSVTDEGNASVHARVKHDLNYGRWWGVVSNGPFATKIERLGDRQRFVGGHGELAVARLLREARQDADVVARHAFEMHQQCAQ